MYIYIYKLVRLNSKTGWWLGVDIKTEDILVYGRVQWYGHVIRRDTNLQIREIMELEIGGKWQKRSS